MLVLFQKGQISQWKKREKKGLLSLENQVYLQLLCSGTSCQQPARPSLLKASLASSQTILSPTGQTSIPCIAQAENGNGKWVYAAEIWRVKTRFTYRGREGSWGSRRPRGELDQQRAEEHRAGKKRVDRKLNDIQKGLWVLSYLVFYTDYCKTYQNKNYHPCVKWRKKTLPRTQIFPIG